MNINRLRLAFALSLVVTAMPFMAGLTGAPYASALLFAGLIALWNYCRGRRPREGATAMEILVTQALSPLLGSAVLVGLGGGLRVVFGVTDMIPIWIWGGIGVCASLLVTLVISPKKAAEMDAFLEEATETLTQMAEDARAARDVPGRTEPSHNTSVLDEEMDALPPNGANREDITLVVRRASQSMPNAEMFDALYARKDTERDRVAMTIWALDPPVALVATGREEAARVFEVLVDAADAQTLELWIVDAGALLDINALTYADLPKPGRMTEIASQIEEDHEELAEKLVSLAQRIEDIEEEIEAETHGE